AKDMATQKEQSIRITPSSGLSKEEIEKMIKDAEMHAEEDRKKKELIEARNHLDGLVYTVEKSLKDYGDKVDEATRKSIEEAIQKAKTALQGNNINDIKRATEELTNSSLKLGEYMYRHASGGAQTGGSTGTGESKKEDVVDATYEEVKDNK
ncbi:MAG: Hsp70 family protein, partial [Proteobacteria bacterium]|nr:Hsp70 family protein [Pseudomonadota bacterium]